MISITIHENALEPFLRHPSFSDNATLIRSVSDPSRWLQTEVLMSGSEDYTDVLQQADAHHHPVSSGWTFVGAIAILVIGFSSLVQFF